MPGNKHPLLNYAEIKAEARAYAIAEGEKLREKLLAEREAARADKAGADKAGAEKAGADKAKADKAKAAAEAEQAKAALCVQEERDLKQAIEASLATEVVEEVPPKEPQGPETPVQDVQVAQAAETDWSGHLCFGVLVLVLLLVLLIWCYPQELVSTFKIMSTPFSWKTQTAADPPQGPPYDPSWNPAVETPEIPVVAQGLSLATKVAATCASVALSGAIFATWTVVQAYAASSIVVNASP
jgi:hypothetical protein